MALQKQVITQKHGATIDNAYLKFAFLRWSDQTQKCTAYIAVFADKDARDNNKSVFETIEIDIDLGIDIQTKIYDELKKLPYFKDAIDV